jgi:hypothetical protein
MKRIHIPNMGPVDGNVTTAIAAAIKECQSMGASEVALITPIKNNLDTIIVGQVLGEAASKRLMKGDVVSVANTGIGLTHHSVGTVAKAKSLQVGLAFYVSPGDMKKLDSLRIDVLLYVPWLDKDGEEWAAKWGAETLGGETQDQEIDLPAEVISSLERLTRRVNISTGLGHPSDKTAAKKLFVDLRSQGIRWQPAEVEKWAVRNGWKPTDAEELAKLSARYT